MAVQPNTNNRYIPRNLDAERNLYPRAYVTFCTDDHDNGYRVTCIQRDANAKPYLCIHRYGKPYQPATD